MAFIRKAWRERALEFVPDKLEELADAIVEAWNRELSPLLNEMLREINRRGGDVRVLDEDSSILRTDRVLLLDGTAGAFTYTLPPVSSVFDQPFTFIKTDSQVTVQTIAAQAGELINGAATYTGLGNQYDVVHLFCDGVQWWITGEYP